jgi:hypothetical protein
MNKRGAETRKDAGYWLLLWGGIVQNAPCNCVHFLIYCAPNLCSNHSRFIHQSSLLWFQHTYLVAKREEAGREMVPEFCRSVSLSHLKESLTCRNILLYGADGFISLRRKWCSKIHRPWLGLNPRTLGPMTSTITITPPITAKDAYKDNFRGITEKGRREEP